MARLLFVGDIVIDQIIDLNGVMHERLGGRTARMAIAAAALGHKVDFVGTVNSAYLDEIKSGLAALGVNTTHVLGVEEPQVTFLARDLPDGEHEFLGEKILQNSAQALTPDHVQTAVSELLRPDMVVTSNSLPWQTTVAAMESLPGVPVVLNTGGATREGRAWPLEHLARLTALVANGEELKFYAQLYSRGVLPEGTTTEQMLVQLAQHPLAPPITVVSRGEEAVLWLSKGEKDVRTVPTYPIVATSTVNASDTQTAGIAAHLVAPLSLGLPLEKEVIDAAIARGNAAAALVVTVGAVENVENFPGAVATVVRTGSVETGLVAGKTDSIGR